MFEVLLYLFQSYIHGRISRSSDAENLNDELQHMGFEKDDILQAFAWLKSLARRSKNPMEFTLHCANSIRVYHDSEQHKLGDEGLELIAYLEQNGVLNANDRELVIDRAMAIELPRLEIYQLKWIAVMILFHGSNSDIPITWVRNLVFYEKNEVELTH